MAARGQIELVNVVGIDFVDDGRSLRLQVTGSVPPYDTLFISFRNAFAIRLYKRDDDEYPFTLVDLTWNEIALEDRENVLIHHAYPLDGVPRDRVLKAKRLFASHLEGALVGDVLAEEIVIDGG